MALPISMSIDRENLNVRGSRRLTSDAVVHPNQPVVRHPPQARDCPRGHGDALQAGAHAGALGVANDIDVLGPQARLEKRLFDEPHDPVTVVERRVLGKKARARRGVVGVAQIGEHDGLSTRGRMGYYAYAQFVR
jgi:hypothetical protein